MTTALLLTGPHAGNVRPTFSVVSELTRRGHQVVHLTTSEFADATASFGASVLTYESAMANLDPAEVFGSGDPMLPHSLYLQENVQILEAAKAAIDASPPDVVLYEDSPFIAGRLVAHRWNRLAVRLSMGFATNDKYSYYQDMVDDSGIPSPLTFDRFRAAPLSGPAEQAATAAVAHHVHQVDGVSAVLLVLDGVVLLVLLVLYGARRRTGRTGAASAWRYREES